MINQKESQILSEIINDYHTLLNYSKPAQDEKEPINERRSQSVMMNPAPAGPGGRNSP